MKTCANKQPSDAWLVFGIWLACAIIFFSVGCSTQVTPQPVTSSQASFDGNQQNSGIIMSTASGFVVTDHFRQRYNAMIATYGGDFKPPLQTDAGIAPIGTDRWLITKQGMVDFLQMNAWRKAGLKPINP